MYLNEPPPTTKFVNIRKDGKLKRGRKIQVGG
jgi:hypothetical protein